MTIMIKKIEEYVKRIYQFDRIDIHDLGKYNK